MKAAMYAMAARAAEVAVAAHDVDTVKVRAAGAAMAAIDLKTARVERAAHVVSTTTAAMAEDTLGISSAMMNTSQLL